VDASKYYGGTVRRPKTMIEKLAAFQIMEQLVAEIILLTYAPGCQVEFWGMKQCGFTLSRRRT
jgi:hypothetical protein